MLVYRICRSKYKNDLSGYGASLYGGRWNPRGVNLVYTAGSISLACLEYLVHNIQLLSSASISLITIEISIPNKVQELQLKNLPDDWNEKSYLPITTQKIGEEFVENGDNYILKAPSAIVPMEYNYLLNPNHKNHKQTKIIDVKDSFSLDERLVTD